MSRAILILIGPPGVGKGTQAKRLSETLALPHLSTGDLFRAEIAKKSPLGRLAEEYTKEGTLIPDTLVMELVFSRLAEPDCVKGAILDGVPRTIAQARILTSRLEPQDHLAVFALEAPDEVALGRIGGRSKTEKRADDCPEIAKQRMAVYHKQTAPLLDHFRALDLLTSIPCLGCIEEIGSAILSQLQILEQR